MQGKSQLSVFFLIGIGLIIAVYISSQYISTPSTGLESAVQLPASSELQLHVEQCLKQVGEDAVYHALLQGGYYYGTLASIPFFNADIPLYWWNAENTMPSKADIESELSLYIDDNLPDCLNDFSVFKQQGYDVSIERAALYFDVEREDGYFDDELADDESFIGLDGIRAAITADSVIYTIEYPVTLRKQDFSITVSDYSASVPINVNHMYSLVAEIMADQAKGSNSFPIGFIAELAGRNKITFELIEYDENTVVVGLIFPQANKPDVIYSFALQYDWRDIDIDTYIPESIQDATGELLG